MAELASVPPGLDSLHAARGIIDRWITDELLAREARRRQLQEDPEVRRRIAANERSILISSLIDRLYDAAELPTDSEIEAYFDRNVDNLQLREPFLRVRYLTASDSTIAFEALEVLDSIRVLVETDSLPGTPGADSLWTVTISRVGENPQASTVLSSSYYPAGRLFRNVPYLQNAAAGLEPGQSTVILSDDSLFHVIQLVDRVEAGTTPRLEWIAEEIRNRLLIERRKQIYADQVQRLRNRALAEGFLEVRE